MQQLDLLAAVLDSFTESESLTNIELYEAVAEKLNISQNSLNKTIPIGSKKQSCSPIKRSIRWAQQSLKASGMIERIDRGCWSTTGKGKIKLSQIAADKYMLVVLT